MKSFLKLITIVLLVFLPRVSLADDPPIVVGAPCSPNGKTGYYLSSPSCKGTSTREWTKYNFKCSNGAWGLANPATETITSGCGGCKECRNGQCKTKKELGLCPDPPPISPIDPCCV